LSQYAQKGAERAESLFAVFLRFLCCLL
jgi:hypothetical protein